MKLSDGSSQIFELSAHIERVLGIEGYPGLFLTRVGEAKPVGITAKWLKPGGRITGVEFSGADVPMDWRPLPDGGVEVAFHPETLPAGRRWQGSDKETRVRLRLDRAVFLAAQKPGRHVIRKSIAIRHDLAGEGPVEAMFLGAVEK